MPRTFSNPLQNPAEPTAAECEALLERVAGSTPLRRSARLRDFLLYVGNHGLHHAKEELHEQQIGSAVFGRQPSYDTGSDNIVRVNATELRKRIDLYFAEEGREEPLLFEIPRGSYTPVFRHREPDPLLEDATPMPDPAAPVQTSDPLPQAAAGRSFSAALVAALAGAIVVLLVVVGVLAWRNQDLQRHLHPWQSQAALRAFWEPFFGRDQTVNILLADTSYALAQDITRQQLSLSDYLNFRYQQVQSLDALSDDARKQEHKDLGMILSRNNGSIGDFRVAQRISALDTRANATHLLFAREYSPDALRHGTSILLGSRRSNPWVELFEDKMVYKFGVSTDRTLATVTIQHPKPGEQAQYASAADPSAKTGYCVIAFLPNLSGGGDTLLLAGTDSQATEAGGEFLTNNDSLESFRRQMGTPGFPHFQLLLRTSRLSGTPLGSEVISYRIAAAP
ncbi:hypothetical protein SAMN05421770_1181 [Granulicella rosea]|uniref:Adenylate cyclase n=1 Tax=Granulicella rosea TaxID=474952 RepID=A0A239MQI3_9BACT|nr:hypothetical protein [Granulicella rosea]SNT44099.1 hypothetical protein SAMN05421770_1181 [Granulicella rosea]